MSESKNLSNEELEFRKALESSDDNISIKLGSIVVGKVIQFDDTDVFIDFEYKSEGKVRRTEFDKEPVIGDMVKVKIMAVSGGYIIASKNAVDKMLSQEVIENAWEQQTTIKGVVREAIKGGFNVSINGTIVFCPFSQMESRRGIKESEHIGKEYDFRIIKKSGKDIVVSRRVIQEETMNADIEEFLMNLKEGDVIQGKVQNIERFGVFVSLVAGLDGFLALSNISWDKSADPKKLLSKGDEKMFKVLGIDKEKKRVDLGLKQVEDDPWGKFVEIYKVGDVIQGEVTNVKKFGAFVKVYDGVEGLVHISDLSWNTHVKNPSDFVKKGAFLECKILEIIVPERRLSLGLKQVKDNPWTGIESTYPVKSTVNCKVRRILKNFAVFELPNGLEGICDISDFDWKNNIVNIKDYVKENDTVEMMVIFIDKEKQRVKLSYKHTKDNPWKTFEHSYPEGSIVEGNVTSIVSVGAVVSLPLDLEGFLHVSQIDMPKGDNIESHITVGETYPFVVREINQSKRRISLSRRDYLEAQAKKEMKSYIAKEEEIEHTFNYFDKLDQNK